MVFFCCGPSTVDDETLPANGRFVKTAGNALAAAPAQVQKAEDEQLLVAGMKKLTCILQAR
jgi:hypothetical protein